jgi:glycosyltransferase 2 family protein
LKRTLITIAKFAVSFGILAYLFYTAWQQDQFQQLAAATKRWEWWLIGLTACLAATLVSFFRWWALVRALDIPFLLRDAIRLGFISQLFNFLSIGVFGGDAMRAYAAARHVPQRMPEAVASVVVDRAIGLLTMFIFGASAFWLSDFSAIQARHPKTLEAVQAVCIFATIVSIVGVMGLILLLVLPVAAQDWTDDGTLATCDFGLSSQQATDVLRVPQ